MLFRSTLFPYTTLFRSGLAERVRALGGIIDAPAEAVGFERQRGRIVGAWLRDGRRLLAGDTVCALGAWSPQLLRQLDLAVFLSAFNALEDNRAQLRFLQHICTREEIS